MSLTEEESLSRCRYVLGEEDWEFFQNVVNSPTSEKPELMKLLQKTPAWETTNQGETNEHQHCHRKFEATSYIRE